MLINQSTNIVGEKVILVPYKESHVPKYNDWMQSPELQQLTASEPLTLDQEYEMQQTWLNSEDKCTFIILDKETWDNTGDELASMIGDTNLFLQNGTEERVAEAEVMIAETWAQGQHRGWEAMLLMLRYGAEQLSIQDYEVKIGMQNIKSQNMFKKIGFQESGRSEVFQEITMNKKVDSQFLSWLRLQTNNSQSIPQLHKINS